MSRNATPFYRRVRLWVALALMLGIICGLVLFLLPSHQPTPTDIPRAPRLTATPAASQQAATPALLFTDVTDAAGIHFTHFAGATGRKWYPETIGSGVAFFDYDGDEKPDILFINSTHWPESGHLATAVSDAPTLQLYRNRGDGSFEEVTKQAGMALPLYGMGVAVADYDNDGDRDVFISGYLRHLFFVNNGNGTFTEATERVGIGGGTWGAGAAFFDYDRDGYLDLVLSSYVEWSPTLEQGLDCTYGTPMKDYCSVRYFKGQGLTLYRNRGDGSFEDVTHLAGVAAEGTRAFAPAILDYNEDGWPDIFVASDGTPSVLLHNQGDGTFEDVGVRTGIVLDEGGAAYAGMGIDVAYPHNDDQLCIAIGNFIGEPTTLHCRMRQEQGFHRQLYAEISARAGLGRATLPYVTFGLFFFDGDLDGLLDLFLLNGHVVDEARLRNAPRAQRPQLFRNIGSGSFQEVMPAPGGGLDRVLVGRGAAYADYDGDGDLDIVLSQNQAGAVLLRNDTPRPGHYVRLQLIGSKSNRDGIGAEVRVYTNATMQRQTVRTGVSYFSQSTLWLTFGLGGETQAQRVEITWPSGVVDEYHAVPADTILRVKEGSTAKVSVDVVTQRATPPAANARESTPAASAASDAYLTHLHTALAAYRAKQYATAAQAFEAAMPLRPTEPLPYRYLADIYWRQGDPERAAQTARALAQVLPDAYFLDRQGTGYEESGLLGLAQQLYIEAVRIDPALPSSRYNLGRTYLEFGELERGIAEIQEALRLYPNFAAAHETLGMAYTEQGRFQAAIVHLKRALALQPAAAVGRNHLGRLYMAQGQLDEAIATFQALIAHHPAAAEARHNLAVAYARKGAHNEAIAQFGQALRLRPTFHAARFDLAALLLEMRRPQEAIEALQTILASPTAGPQRDAGVSRVEVRYRLGLAHVRAQQVTEAIKALEGVISEQPGHAEAHVYLGQLYYRQGQFAPAWQHARQAESLGAPIADLIAALRRVSVEP